MNRLESLRERLKTKTSSFCVYVCPTIYLCFFTQNHNAKCNIPIFLYPFKAIYL